MSCAPAPIVLVGSAAVFSPRLELGPGPVDLVERREGRHSGGGHGFTCASECFVGPSPSTLRRWVIAVERRHGCRGKRSECAAGDGGRRSEVSEPIQKRGKDAKGGADDAGVASVPCSCESPNPHTQGSQRLTVLRLATSQEAGQVCPLARLPLSRAISRPRRRAFRRHRDRRPEGEPTCEKGRWRAHTGFGWPRRPWIRPSAASSASSPRPANSSAIIKLHPGRHIARTTGLVARQLVAGPVHRSFGLADHQECIAQ